MSIARQRADLAIAKPKSKGDSIAGELRYYAGVVLAVTIGMSLFGLWMGYSASAVRLISEGLSPMREVSKELLITLGGFLSLAVFGLWRYPTNIRSLSLYIGVKSWFWLSFTLLVVLLFVAKMVKGSVRTLDFGAFHFQPTELAKFCLIMYVLYLMLVEPTVAASGCLKETRFVRFFTNNLTWLVDLRNPGSRLLFALAVSAVTMLLVLLQPDIGSTLFMEALVLIALFLSGVRKRVLFSVAVISLFVILIAVLCMPKKFSHATTRFKAWVHPLGTSQLAGESAGAARNRGNGAESSKISDSASALASAQADKESFQISQSLGAIANGGLMGEGYFRGVQKINRLPEATNDFIFAVICEELGFLGAIVVIAGYLVLLYYLSALAGRIRSPFYSALVYLIGFSLFLQAFINMAAAVNLLPTKGINLPLISFGGSSKLITLSQIGVALGIARCYSLLERTRV